VTFFVDLRQWPVGGSLAASPTVYDDRDDTKGLGDLLSACAGREVLFVTHGFNVDRAGGIEHLTTWHDALAILANGNPPFIYVGVLWPGDSKWLPVIDYPIEGNEANGSGDMLAQFILGNLSQAASISLASHSLGARVVLETARQLNAVARLFIMAGAIEDDCFANEYSDAAAKVAKISVLASEDDQVLEWAFPAGNLLGTILMRGSPYARVALGRHGPTLPTQVTAGWQLPVSWGYNHGDYLPSIPVTPADISPGPMSFPGPISGTPYAPPNLPAPPSWKAAWTAGLLLDRW
jgi:hypothetical protein